MAARWYALYVHPNAERAVAAHLAGFQAFYPHYLEQVRDKHRHHRTVERKFFPGYVFARFDLDHKLPVVSEHLVVSIVGYGPSQPVAITDSEIEAVRTLAGSSLASTSAPCPYLDHGDKVRIRWGPLVGLEGYVVRGRKLRVVVTVEALGQSRSVEVEREAVERIALAA